jgi:signal transduction histidine kinase
MKFPLFRSLAARLVLSHMIVGAISVGIIASIAGHFIMETGRREVQNIYEDTAFLISSGLEMPLINFAEGEGLDGRQIQAEMDRWLNTKRIFNYSVFLPDGAIVITNETNEDLSASVPEIMAARVDVEGEDIRNNRSGQETFYVAVPITHKDQLYGILRLSVTFQDTLQETYHSLYLLAAISTLLLLAVGVGSWWFSNTLSRPIHDLTLVADRMSRGELQARSLPKGPQELQQFASTFNQMASHLQTNMEGLQAFVANASHELRTPLTAIKLHVDALAEGAVSEPEIAMHFLAQLQDEIERMSHTVNDLLDLSRIEANRGRIRMEDVDLRDILQETRDFWRARSQQAGLDLRLSLPQNTSKVMGDEDQLRRVIYNLVDNAIKHTSPGGWVEISLFNLPQRGVARIEVRDNGMGILAEHLPRIFERFYRAEVPLERKTPGSGLGLAIAKSIIEAHNGKIGVSSLIGVGSTFWVELRIAVTSSNDRKTIPLRSETTHG